MQSINVLSLFKNIKLFVLDVDGVLTNSKVLLLDDGQEARTMNVKDGYAIQLAVKNGYEFIVISGGISKGVELRLKRLGIANVYMGIRDKWSLLNDFLQKNNIASSDVAFLGDDVPDYESMCNVGLACCPADAVMEIKNISHYISNCEGGNCFVRDVLEKVLKLNESWETKTLTRSN